MKQLIQIPASVINMNPRSDKSWKLVFESGRELSGEEVKLLTDNFQGEGFLVFSPNDIKTTDIPSNDAEIEGKTPSERLRNVLYIYWKQRGEQGDFDGFYRTQMNKLIDGVKTKLDKEDA